VQGFERLRMGDVRWENSSFDGQTSGGVLDVVLAKAGTHSTDIRRFAEHIIFQQVQYRAVSGIGTVEYTEVQNSAVHYSTHILHCTLLCAPRSCPGWEDLCEARWSTNVLLLRNDCVIDLAYLEGVWRYSYAVGKVFICGLRKWPPAPEYGTVF